MLLSEELLGALYDAAEGVAEAHHHLARLCHQQPALLDRLGLSPVQRLLWASAAPQWHGIARADVFWTEAGPQVCELNSDTPSGQAEAVLTNALAHQEEPTYWDPNQHLGARLCQMIGALAQRALGRPPRVIGILYPTEMTEDLSMIQLLTRWFEAQGWRVVLGSPYNVVPASGGRVALFGEVCDVFYRHYKTDWWGERVPVWRDAPGYPDEEPLTRPLDLILSAQLRGQVAVVNPFGAVLTQNKRALALLWEELAAFPAQVQDKVRRYLPHTARMESIALEALRAEKDSWVLKSDYGCEGDEVVIGRECTTTEWEEALTLAIPTRFVAQRFFAALGDAPGETINYGVYLLAGQASGLYARIQSQHTDIYAQSAPALVRPGPAG